MQKVREVTNVQVRKNIKGVIGGRGRRKRQGEGES